MVQILWEKENFSVKVQEGSKIYFFGFCPDISLVSNNDCCKFIFTSKLTLLHIFYVADIE